MVRGRCRSRQTGGVDDPVRLLPLPWRVRRAHLQRRVSDALFTGLYTLTRAGAGRRIEAVWDHLPGAVVFVVAYVIWDAAGTPITGSVTRRGSGGRHMPRTTPAPGSISASRCVSRGRRSSRSHRGRHGLVRDAVADRRRGVRGLQRPPGVPTSRPVPPTPPVRRRRVHDPDLTPGPP